MAFCYIWLLSVIGSVQLVNTENPPEPINQQAKWPGNQPQLGLSPLLPAKNLKPVDRVYYDEVWKLQSHSSVTIPVPRAPFPTFGMILPLPKWWSSTERFYPVDADQLKVQLHGVNNYILDSAVARFESLVRTRTGLSSYALQWLHQQSILPKLAQEHLKPPISSREKYGTAGVEPNSATRPSGRWPAKAVDILRQRFVPFMKTDKLVQGNQLRQVTVLVKSAGAPWPSLHMDESYIISIASQEILLYANETWGALHGLTSLTQLLWRVPGNSQVYVNQSFVHDAPRFPHRGLMVDTSRHFISKQILLLNLETMAFNKMNVFHWHLVDDQSYPYQSAKFPNLSQQGGYTKKEIYSVQDIKEVIEFGRVRGIRVIPEFDLPGHTRSLAYSMPNLLAHCTNDLNSPDTYFGPLNPFKNETYTFLRDLLSEVFHLFHDEFVHLGGDEVETGCWAADPDMRIALEKMQFSDDRAIHEYFWRNLQNLVTRLRLEDTQHKRRIIVWEDALEHVNELQKSLVVHVWKSDLSVALQQGYNVIYSTCWYLDLLWDVRKWPSYYLCDPVMNPSGLPVLPMQQNRVLGGEACMWTEYQWDDTILQKIWPITSAIAERLWSPHFVNSIETVGPRIEEQRCRLIDRGVPVGVLNGPGFCPSPGLMSRFVQPDAAKSSLKSTNDALDQTPSHEHSVFTENKLSLATEVNSWYCILCFFFGLITGIGVVCLVSSGHTPLSMNSLVCGRFKVIPSRTGLLFAILVVFCFFALRGFCL